MRGLRTQDPAPTAAGAVIALFDGQEYEEFEVLDLRKEFEDALEVREELMVLEGRKESEVLDVREDLEALDAREEFDVLDGGKRNVPISGEVTEMGTSSLPGVPPGLQQCSEF